MFNNLKLVGLFVGAICFSSIALNTSWAEDAPVNPQVTDATAPADPAKGECPKAKAACDKKKKDCGANKKCTDASKKCDAKHGDKCCPSKGDHSHVGPHGGPHGGSHGHPHADCDKKKDCSSHGHSHAGCAKKKDCGSHKSCKSKDGYHAGGHSVESMMGLVYCAKKELLKEKIKGKLQKKVGKQLDEIADLFVNALVDQQASGADPKKGYEELGKKLREICTSHNKKEEKK